MSVEALIAACADEMQRRASAASDPWSLIEDYPTTLSSWTDIATPTEATGVADPFGGTNAWTTGDDNASGFEGHRFQGLVSLAGSTAHRVRVRVKKDAITARYPEFQLILGSANAMARLNTSTGVASIRVSSNWTDVSASAETDPLDSGWWRLDIFFTTTASGGMMRMDAYPAAGPDASTLSSSTTGSITWYAPSVYEEA